ncbi:MAG TPA: ABC transporter permease [Deltaproteobacteria bacterium]|nr:ABC transporter permease [Deltaproteobacteria bacterium]OQC29315.1 MAG: Sulfate transport system permease protein CysW [Deltaproteobacteria bacterium ADurb.Bin072]HRW81280.1 ABC transporter permease [Desulfomonilia bacterium]NMD40893.1 ABC transporter permease [Deltaproteobacteria bacterium]HNQ85018.1 ABC transporter permease [Deltaproteobacteria bacterium]
MGYISEGFIRAIDLLASFDEETYSAVFTTIRVSAMSIAASLAIGIPVGFALGYFTFPTKRQVRAVVDTMLALPTVVVGLIVYTFISRRGPLGEFELLYTQPGIAIAQTLLVVPIVISLTATAVEGLDRRLKPTLHALGARGAQIALTSLMEARYAVLIAAITAYGRAISEVGASMIIGGNIKWHTRTITTAIALETGKGEFGMAIALGLVLLLLAFLVNGSLAVLRKRS